MKILQNLRDKAVATIQGVGSSISQGFQSWKDKPSNQLSYDAINNLRQLGYKASAPIRQAWAEPTTQAEHPYLSGANSLLTGVGSGTSAGLGADKFLADKLGFDAYNNFKPEGNLNKTLNNAGYFAGAYLNPILRPKSIAQGIVNPLIGSAFGAGSEVFNSVVNDTPLTSQGVLDSALSGAKGSVIFPATNYLTNQVLGNTMKYLPQTTKVLQPLTDQALSKTGQAITQGAVNNGIKSILSRLPGQMAKAGIRETLETPLETAYFAQTDKTGGDTYQERYKNRLAGDALSNLLIGSARAPISTGGKVTFDRIFSKPDVKVDPTKTEIVKQDMVPESTKPEPTKGFTTLSDILSNRKFEVDNTKTDTQAKNEFDFEVLQRQTNLKEEFIKQKLGEGYTPQQIYSAFSYAKDSPTPVRDTEAYVSKVLQTNNFSKPSSVEGGGKVEEDVKPQAEIPKVETPIRERIRTLDTRYASKEKVKGSSAEVEASKARQELDTTASDLIKERNRLGITSERAFQIRETPKSKLTGNELDFKETMDEWNKNTHAFRENPKLGTHEDYAPRMWGEQGESVKAPGLGWMNETNLAMSTSKYRTGTGEGYKTDFDSVIKDEVEQIVLDKYGKQIGIKTGDYNEIKDIVDTVYKDPNADVKYLMDRAEKLAQQNGIDDEISKKIAQARAVLEKSKYDPRVKEIILNGLRKDVFPKIDEKIKQESVSAKTVEYSKKMIDHLRADREGVKVDDKGVEDFNNYKAPNKNFDYVGESGKRFDGKKETLVIDHSVIEGYNDLKVNQPEVKTALDNLRDASSAIELNAERIMKLPEAQRLDAIYEVIKTADSNKEQFIDYANFIRDKNGIPDDQMVEYFLVRSRKAALQNLIDTLGKYEVYGKGKDYLNKFIDMEMKLGELKESALSKFTRVLANAHLAFNAKTAILQSTESLRLPAFYGKEDLVNGAKLRVTYMKSGIDLNKKYGFDSDKTGIYDNYKMVQAEIKKEVSVEDILKQNRVDRLNKKQNKIIEAGYKPIQFTENKKNEDFLATIEASLRRTKNYGDADFEVGKKGWTDVRETAFKQAFIADKYNNPEAYQFSDLFKFLAQYGRYGMMEINAVKEKVGKGEYGSAVALVGARVASAYLLGAVTGRTYRSIGDFVENIAPIGVGPGPQIAYELGSDIYDIMKEDIDTEEKKVAIIETISKQIPRNIIPGGTQILKSKGAIDDILRGHGESYSGKSITYDAPKSVPSAIMGLVFGKKATSEAKDWSKDPTYIWGNDKKAIDAMPKESQQAAIDKERVNLQNEKNLESILKQKTGGDTSLMSIFSKKKEVNISIPTKESTSKDKSNFKSLMKTYLDSDVAIDDDQASYYHFEGKTAKTTNLKDKSDVYKKLHTIMQSDYSDTTKEQALKTSGATKEQYEYYETASLNQQARMQEIAPMLGDLSEKKNFEELVKLKATIAGKAVLQSDMVNYLYDMGEITKEQKEFIDAVKYDEATGKFYIKRGSKYHSGGTGKKPKTLTYSQALSYFKVDVKGMNSSSKFDLSKLTSRNSNLLQNILNKRSIS